MKRTEFMQFLEKQNLNGLQPNHIQRAIKALEEMGEKNVPTVAQVTRWINRVVWA